MQNIDNATAFDRIYETTYRRVHVYIAAKCNNPSDIPDILQEIYMEIYNILCKRGVAYMQNEEAFVMGVAKQKLYQHYALFKRLQMHVSMFVKNAENQEEAINDCFIDDVNVCDDSINAVLFEEIQRHLKGKAADIQKIFYLHYGLSLTLEETAAELSMKLSGVKNKLYRTLQELRQKYEVIP